jgi:hypothetical protein
VKIWIEKASGQEKGLAGYWNFQDGTAKDSSPYKNNGQLVGGCINGFFNGIKSYFFTIKYSFTNKHSFSCGSGTKGN